MLKKQVKTNMKPWITKGFIKSSRKKNKLYKKYLSSGTEELKTKYKNYRNRLTHWRLETLSAHLPLNTWRFYGI